MTKAQVRNIMLEKREALSKTAHKIYSERAIEAIKKHPFYKQSKHIGIYHPIRSELDLLPLTADDKKFYLPKVFDQKMHYLPINFQDLQLSDLGIMEPTSEAISDDVLELIIVPALAVDEAHQRLGYGKGFFDVFLTQHPKIKTIGVVMDFQFLKAIPCEPHDVALHDIIVIDIK